MALIHLLDAGSKFVKKENVISEKCNKAKHNKKKEVCQYMYSSIHPYWTNLFSYNYNNNLINYTKVLC